MSNSNQTGDQLYQLLMEEASAYDYLLEILLEKQSAMVKNDLPIIENLTGVEQVLVQRANDFTKARTTLMQDYFNKIDGAPKVLSLNAMIRTLDKKDREPWERLNLRLQKTAAEIKLRNAENLRLIETSLNYVRGEIDMFLPREELSSDLYSQSGDGNQNFSAKNLLDCNA